MIRGIYRTIITNTNLISIKNGEKGTSPLSPLSLQVHEASDKTNAHAYEGNDAEHQKQRIACDRVHKALNPTDCGGDKRGNITQDSADSDSSSLNNSPLQN